MKNRSSSFFRATLIAGFVLLLLPGCLRDNVFGIHGSGSTVTETHNNLDPFTKVDVSIDANVILHVDSTYHITLQGQQNVLNVLSTSVHGDRLKLDFTRNVLSHSGITIDVYAPYYAAITLSGSGHITNAENWSSSDFETSLSGSGSISLSGLQATSVQAKISGSGEITLDGSCQGFECQISGSGDIHGFGLAGSTGSIETSGSGDCELNLSQSLNVRISGSGDVYYKNNPVLDVSITGSGRVIHVQ